MSEWQALISGVAFPIAVAAYLLVYMRKTLETLKEALAANTAALARVCEHLDETTKT